MDENTIASMRQAMFVFLKSLPLNCHFKIIRFGFDHRSLFSETSDQMGGIYLVSLDYEID